MIIKVSKRESKSDYGRLASYISEPKLKGDERIEEVWLNNFEGDETDWEVGSILVSARHKTKADFEKDMTYHLIVSFTPEESEKLDSEALKKIGQQIAESIELGKHERISAVHGDTKNKHMHMAINLLDEHNRYKEPYKAYVALKQIRQEIEAEHGFEGRAKDNRAAGKPQLSEENTKRASHSNMNSFEGWLKEHVAEDLKKTINQEGASWSAVHKQLKLKGAELRKRGAGFVFSHESEKFFVKASSIDRGFSFKKLTDQLGEFEEPRGLDVVESEKRYKSHFVGSKELFSEYQQGLKVLRELRAKDRAAASELFKSAKDEISKSVRASKEEVKALNLEPKLSSSHLKRLTFEGRQRMEGAIAENQARMVEIKRKYKHSTWNEFLQSKAREGDLTAIEALQRKGIHVESSLTGNELYTEGDWKSVGSSMRDLSCRVLGSGDLVYQTKHKSEIRDKGGRLILGENFSDESIDASLALAKAKFGKTLHLRGSAEFIEAVQKRAEELNLDVRFSENEKTYLEKKREWDSKRQGGR